jgi:hypothetical protein
VNSRVIHSFKQFFRGKFVPQSINIMNKEAHEFCQIHENPSTCIWTGMFQNKMCEELDQIFQGSDRPATMKDLNEMKYPERVIKESMRLYPFTEREITEDIQICKQNEFPVLTAENIKMTIFQYVALCSPVQLN